MQSPSVATFEDVAGRLLADIQNGNTKAVYRTGLEGFLNWWKAADRGGFDAVLIRAHLKSMADAGLSSSTINQRLTAIRRLAGLASETGLIDLKSAAEVARISNSQRHTAARQQALRVSESEALINAPSASTTKGVRDRALIAMLIGCGLRRGELVNLQIHDVLTHSHQWLLARVVGPRGRVRGVVVPGWVKEALEVWMRQAQLSQGPLFRSVDREGQVGSQMISPQTVRAVVAEHARSIGLSATPEDLRRTCARLCRDQGGELHQIQMMLGHSRVESTERLLGRHEVAMRSPNVLIRMKWYNRGKVAS